MVFHTMHQSAPMPWTAKKVRGLINEVNVSERTDQCVFLFDFICLWIPEEFWKTSHRLRFIVLKGNFD